MNEVAAVLIGLLLIAILIGLAIAESALNRVSRSRAEALEEDDVPGAAELVEGLSDRRRLVAPILALSLGSQLALGAIVAVTVSNRAGLGWVPVALVALLGFMLIVTESVPKTWAQRNIDRAAPRAASFSRGILAIAPIRWILSGLGGVSALILKRTSGSLSEVTSEEEIVAMTDAAVAEKVLDQDEGRIIQELVEFGDTLVREIMVPRPDVLAASTDTTVSIAIEMMVERGHSRMPIYGDDVDDVAGIVHIKDLFARVQRGRGDHFVSIALRPPMFIPETKRAAELLRELRGVPTTLVVVIDEYGSMAGIVTMEDLIEEILGEIVDEFDAEEEPLVALLTEGRWRVHGRVTIDEFNEMVGADLPDDEWDTVGGLIFNGLGRVPRVGESVTSSGFQLIVEAVDGRRITHILAQRQAEPSETLQLTDDTDKVGKTHERSHERSHER